MCSCLLMVLSDVMKVIPTELMQERTEFFPISHFMYEDVKRAVNSNMRKRLKHKIKI